MQKQSNTLNFNGQNVYAGFDVHQRSWTVTIMTEKLVHKTFSQDPKPEILHQYLVKNFPGAQYHTAYEAGFCGYWIHNQLKALGINSLVVNPADIPTTGKEKIQKDDPRDSKKIARSLRNGDLKGIYVPSAQVLSDRTLMRTRSTLVKDLARFKNRTKSFLYFHGIEIPQNFQGKVWSKVFIEWLEKVELTSTDQFSLQTLITSIKNIKGLTLQTTRKIQELSKSSHYKEDVVLLRSIPGIGLLTAMTILTELETILRFESIDKLCSFIGLVPSTHSSGENETVGNITPRGHSRLRSAIIESAWTAARHDPALAKSYNDYCRRMPENRAIVRIAKKLMTRIKFVLKNKQSYVCSVVK